MVGGRPRKTAEELDAEMEDYWGGGGNDGQDQNQADSTAHPATIQTDGDIDMDI